MKKIRLANLTIGGIFFYAEGGGKDTRIKNCYWIKVADCFDVMGKYIGCRCCEILMGEGEVLDTELLPQDLVVVLTQED